MSIKKAMLPLKGLKKTYVIFALFFLFSPFKSYCWYIEKKHNDFFLTECQFFEKEYPVNSYIMFFNSDNEGCSGIYPEDSGERVLIADRIFINLAVSLMVKESVVPSSDLDRLIAVNLNLKRLVTELEEMEIRARRLMADLSIPYLEKGESISKKNFYDIRKSRLKKDLLKKDIENSTKYSSFTFSRADIGGPLVQLSQKGNTASDFKGENRPSRVEPGTGFKSNGLGIDHAKDKSLPWVFRLVLSISKYIVLNKYKFIFFGVSLSLILFFAINRLKND